ncbi:unnamed protein product, partial [Brassica oleracea]
EFDNFRDKDRVSVDTIRPWSILRAQLSPSLKPFLKRFSLSLWLLDETAPRRNGSVCLRGCRRRRKTVIFSLYVCLLDGDGPLSLCVSPRFDYVSWWLSTTATELSVGGSPRIKR